MVKHYETEHNSGEWFNLRAGVATSSQFDKILTKGGNLSEQSDAYANKLIAELLLGKPIDREFSTFAMEWGHAYEGEAVKLYEFETDSTVKKGGFFLSDDMMFGASPDARIYSGDEVVGLAEIKCPENPANHIEFLLMQEMNPKYIPQVQGQLYVSGMQWVDWFSYYPEMPSARIRVFRDETYQKKLHDALEGFRKIFDKKVARLI